jgi:hypothetical protein
MLICYTLWKICKNLWLFLSSLHNEICRKCIIWPKKSSKGRHEWNKAHLNLNIHLQKLNTPKKLRWKFDLLQKKIKLIFYLNLFLFFSYVCLIHNICLILVTCLPIKSLCSKGPCNLRILLSFVIAGKILLELVVGWFLISFGTSLK